MKNGALLSALILSGLPGLPGSAVRAQGLLPDGVREIVFAVRRPGGDGHWYANFGYYAYDENKKCYTKGGRLCRLDLATGRLRILVEDPDGTVRDPVVHYDGNKVLFSWRRGGEEDFHLYEIHADGSGLRQLTRGPYSDIEPVYLPDGDILFISSRCRRWVPCWVTQVATLHRCDADGSNIRRLSSNIEQDNAPWLLPDGRILYTRWEYVDRSRVSFHGLWFMNPDGTGQMVFYGNMHPGSLYIDAKPIPGTNRVVMVNSPGHGKTEHYGRIAILTTDLGPDSREAERIITQKPDFCDPYPVSSDCFLVASKQRLLRMDDRGGTQTLYTLPEELARDGAWLHEPRPLRPRPREPVVRSQVALGEKTGRLAVLDAYVGRNMKGIDRGAIKKLLILESLPKPINFTGGMDPISYGGSYTLNRVIGTVPVESDGSAYMEVPANRSLFFVALDARDLSVKRMMSFLTVMPGETTTCIGCHEDRTRTAPERVRAIALRREPSRPEPVPDTPEIFDYPRDIQPLIDRHCLPCHDVEERQGGVLLTGDNGPVFTHSYFMLSARLQIADGRDLARGNYAPRQIGSSASYLMDKVDGSHYDAKVTDRERRMLALWIDASATFPGTYAALRSGMIGLNQQSQLDRSDARWPCMQRGKEVTERRCGTCHHGARRLPTSPSDNLGFKGKELVYGKGQPRFWTPPWVEPYGDGTLRPGSREWMKTYADPRLQYSRHILYNLSRPAKSVLLMAPLSKAAGGYGICGDVFKDTADPDYRVLLEAIQYAKAHLEKITRFTMPHFRPERDYVREMKRFGILPDDFQAGAPIDVYETDRKYWASLYE